MVVQYEPENISSCKCEMTSAIWLRKEKERNNNNNKKHTYVSDLHCGFELLRLKWKELRGHAPLAARSIAFFFFCYQNRVNAEARVNAKAKSQLSTE